MANVPVEVDITEEADAAPAPTPAVPNPLALTHRMDVALDRLRRHWWWLALGAVALSIVVTIPIELMGSDVYRACHAPETRGNCDSVQFMMATFIFSLVVLGTFGCLCILAGIGSYVATRPMRRREKEVQAQAAAAREWVVRGHLAPSDYAKLQQAQEQWTRRDQPGVVAHFARQTLIPYAILNGIAAVVFIFVLFEEGIDDQQHWATTAMFFALTAFWSTLAVVSVREVVSAHRRGAAANRIADATYRNVEQRILEAAYARQAGKASAEPLGSPAAGSQTGMPLPSYTAWSGTQKRF